MGLFVMEKKFKYIADDLLFLGVMQIQELIVNARGLKVVTKEVTVVDLPQLLKQIYFVPTDLIYIILRLQTTICEWSVSPSLEGRIDIILY